MGEEDGSTFGRKIQVVVPLALAECCFQPMVSDHPLAWSSFALLEATETQMIRSLITCCHRKSKTQKKKKIKQREAN